MHDVRITNIEELRERLSNLDKSTSYVFKVTHDNTEATGFINSIDNWEVLSKVQDILEAYPNAKRVRFYDVKTTNRALFTFNTKLLKRIVNDPENENGYLSLRLGEVDEPDRLIYGITAYLPKRYFEQIKQMSKEKGYPVSLIARDLILRYLDFINEKQQKGV